MSNQKEKLSLNTYLVYNGDCERAFSFYKSVFVDAELYIARYQDAPEQAKQFFVNAVGESVLHATLTIDENTVLMGNDNPDPLPAPAKPSFGNFYLYIEAEDPKEAIRIFNGLSACGKIILPIAETFWSPVYGIFIDRFGVRWKITSHQSLDA